MQGWRLFWRGREGAAIPLDGSRVVVAEARHEPVFGPGPDAKKARGTATAGRFFSLAGTLG